MVLSICDLSYSQVQHDKANSARRDVVTVRYVNSAPQHHSNGNGRTVVLSEPTEIGRPRNQKEVRGNINTIDTIDSRIQQHHHTPDLPVRR